MEDDWEMQLHIILKVLVLRLAGRKSFSWKTSFLNFHCLGCEEVKIISLEYIMVFLKSKNSFAFYLSLMFLSRILTKVNEFWNRISLKIYSIEDKFQFNLFSYEPNTALNSNLNLPNLSCFFFSTSTSKNNP